MLSPATTVLNLTEPARPLHQEKRRASQVAFSQPEKRPRELTVKTKEKIVQASLELFNQHGERSITTNHIAAHISISPGNLYYHFRNKSDIIARIFDRYEQAVDNLFQLPDEGNITLEDRALLTDKLLDLIWQYRFMHRDLVGMLANDDDLKTRYRQFANRAIRSTEQLYVKMNESGFMAIPNDQLKPLSLNIWILATSWTTYLRTAEGVAEDQLTREQLNQLIYQMTCMELPYLTEATREETQELIRRYGPDQH